MSEALDLEQDEAIEKESLSSANGEADAVFRTVQGQSYKQGGADSAARSIAEQHFEDDESSDDEALRGDRYRMLRSISTLSNLTRLRSSSQMKSINPSPFSKTVSYSSARYNEILNAQHISNNREAAYMDVLTQLQDGHDRRHSTSDLKAYKDEVKKQLKTFDNDFKLEHGRMPTEEEKEPVKYLYKIYNIFKDEVILREAEEEQTNVGITTLPPSEIHIDWTHDKSSMRECSSESETESYFQISQRRGRESHREERDDTDLAQRSSRLDVKSPQRDKNIEVEYESEDDDESSDEEELYTQFKPRRVFSLRSRTRQRSFNQGGDSAPFSSKHKQSGGEKSSTARLARSLSPARGAISRRSAGTGNRTRKNMFLFRSKSKTESNVSLSRSSSMHGKNDMPTRDSVDSQTLEPKKELFPSFSKSRSVKSILRARKYSMTKDADDEQDCIKLKSNNSKQREKGPRGPQTFVRNQSKSTSTVPAFYDVEIGVDGMNPAEKEPNVDRPPPQIEYPLFGNDDEGTSFVLSACGIHMPRLLPGEAPNHETPMRRSADCASSDGSYSIDDDPKVRTIKAATPSMVSDYRDTAFDIFDKIDQFFSLNQREDSQLVDESGHQ